MSLLVLGGYSRHCTASPVTKAAWPVKAQGTVVASAIGGLKQGGSTQSVHPHGAAPRRDPGALRDQYREPCPIAVAPGTHHHAQILPAGWDNEPSAWWEVGGVSFYRANHQAEMQTGSLQRCFVPLRDTGTNVSMVGAGLGTSPQANLRNSPWEGRKQPPCFLPRQHNSLPACPTWGQLGAVRLHLLQRLLLGTHPALGRVGELKAAPGLRNSSVSRAFIQ